MKKIIRKLLSQSSKNKIHKLQTNLAILRYGNASKKMTIIGVTGTKGKTSVCNMISSVLDAANLPNAMETTINTKMLGKINYHTEKSLWITTPPAHVLYKFLKDAKKQGATHIVLEVTSSAIDQFRTHGIDFDVLVYTNLSHDHLDYHKTIQNYLNAKLKVFKQNPQAKFVINRDDQHWNLFYNLAATEKFLYSTKNPVEHGTVARKMLLGPDSATFTVAYDNGQSTVNSHLPGTFNVSNMLAAFCVGLALDIKPETIKQGLENVTGIRGRMEQIVAGPKQDFTVIVDYAHNADSLKNVYETVKESMQKAGGRMIAVLGATGRRDTTKRPIMGALAGNYADLIIVTDEDPYDEDPNEIIEAVAAGVLKGGKKNQWRLNRNYWKVLDRKQAIHKAIVEAKKGDVVVITGKGAEEVMAVGEHEFIPFSDRKIAKEELEKRFLKK